MPTNISYTAHRANSEHAAVSESVDDIIAAINRAKGLEEEWIVVHEEASGGAIGVRVATITLVRQAAEPEG